MSEFLLFAGDHPLLTLCVTYMVGWFTIELVRALRCKA